MGFIGDLFKEKVDWNESEIIALFGSLSAMGAMDGVTDENEIAVIAEAVTGMPSQITWNKETMDRLMKKSLEIKAEQHIAVLQSMHNKKKRIALGALAAVALADGEMDDIELTFWNGMRSALQV